MKFITELKKNKITIGNTTYSGVSATVTHRLVSAIPLLMVNSIAIAGQMGWAHDHLQSWHYLGQLAFALGLESVAVFFAFHAYLCEKRNDSAMRLKIASYSFALVVAAINYSHFTTRWNKPTAVGIVVGMMSAISPWLWGTFSRNVSRNILFSRGLIEEHALRLGATRWLWHPIKCIKLMYYSTWIGENNPSKAIRAWENDEIEKSKRNQGIQISTNNHNNDFDVKDIFT